MCKQQILCISSLRVTISGKSCRKVRFTSKGGGQTCFLNFWNKLTLNWHNFFVFDSNSKFFKRGIECDQISHPADFWIPRPPHWPEISVCPKNYVFPPLGDLPPDNDNIKKTFLFFILGM